MTDPVMEDLQQMLATHSPLEDESVAQAVAEDSSGENTQSIEGQAAAEDSESIVVQDQVVSSPDATAADSADTKPEVPDYSAELDGFRKGMMEERRKRQELELQIAQMKGRLEGTSDPAKPKESDEDDDDFWADPKSYTKKVAEQAVLRDREQRWMERANRSVERAQKKHEDYQEMQAKFIELANTPEYAHWGVRMRNEDDPGEFIYQTMTTHLAPPPRSEDEIRAELESRIREEYEAKFGQLNQESPTRSAKKPPTSLASMPSAPAKTTPSAAMKSQHELLAAVSRSDY